MKVSFLFQRMGPKKRKGGLIRKLTIGEDFKIGIHLALEKFRNTDDDKGNIKID